MSFRFHTSAKTELQAIDISIGRHFFVPLMLLISMIVGLSAVLESTSGISRSYTADELASGLAINRLQRKIADLEGESQRVNEFAQKLVKLAKLDNGLFNFDSPPGRGGLGGRNIFRRYTSGLVRNVSRDADTLKKQLINQSNQFERMQLVLKSRILGETEKQSRWPVATAYVSSNYGVRKDPFTGRRRKHNGIDLAGPRGSDILSVADGKVVFTGRKGGYGRFIEIKHANGFRSRYAHLEKSLVKKGQVVKVGEKIARLGSSGRSTGPHLHLEVLKNKKHIDPRIFLGERH